MAKDYFQDIVPPHRPPRKDRRFEGEPDEGAVPIPIHSADTSGRSIRNISAPSRARPLREPPLSHANLGSSGRGRSRFWIWGVAIICVIVLAALLFVALRPTRVTIIPRSYALTFQGDTFIAAPEASAALGTLRYSVQTIELDDSKVVESTGVVYGEDKASGTLTVYNNYQTEPLKLVKNTRFQTASGLIFRAPAEIVVPAKKGNVAGSVDVTVVADQPGQQYNVAAGSFTLPGLKSAPAMYTQITAESREPFTGGFVGERPGVAAGSLESAIADLRSRLETRARQAVEQVDDNLVAFPALAQIEYVNLPNTNEAGGGVRVHQRARVSIPVFPKDSFTGAVGASAIVGTDPAAIEMLKGKGFDASPASTSTVLGSGNLQFSLVGSALLVWQVNEAELKAALVGKDKAAFETIVGGFTAVQKASARIEPFWKNTFPDDPGGIKVTVETPEVAE